MSSDGASEIRRLSDEVAAITGTEPFVYATSPTPTTTKWVFQEATFTSAAEALSYVRQLLAEAPGRRMDMLEGLAVDDTISTRDGLHRIVELEIGRDENKAITSARARITEGQWIDLLTEGWKVQ